MPMNQDTVWQRLIEVGPFANEDEARRAFEATLRALRRGLSEDEADWLAVALGPTLAEPLLREGYAGDLPKVELYRWMKRYTKARKGIAVEYAQVVCRVLAELLPDADLERVKRHLPQLAFLFERPVPGAPLPARHRRGDSGDRTLAGGRPGSSRPLSDAAPRSERHSPGSERSQGPGVAPPRDTHAEGTLAGARGLLQDRESRAFRGAGHGIVRH